MSRFDDSDGEEHYEDVKEEEEEDDNEDKKDKPEPQQTGDNKDKVAESSWNFNARLKGHQEKAGYDPQCRNPLYSGAEKSPFWELDRLCEHYHPTVQLFSKNLSENTPIKYAGDPLNDFTVAKFLDRFVFRNPKKDPAKNKPSTIHGQRNIYRPTGIKMLAPDSREFLTRSLDSVPGDELYLYKYFQAKSERAGDKEDKDSDSVTSEEFNNFLDQMGGRAKDFEGEDIDFASGVHEGGEDDAEEDGDGDDDDDDQDEDNDQDEDGSEPEGLDGEDDDEFKELSDEEAEAGGEVDYLDDDEDMNEEDLDFSDDQDSEEEAPKKGKAAATASKKKGAASILPPLKKKKKEKFKFDPNDLSSLLADADEFSHLLQDNQETGTSGSMRTKDKASAKQLNWEERRNNFMTSKPWTKGRADGRSKGHKGPSGSKGPKNSAGSKGKRPAAKGGLKPAKKKAKR